MSGDHYLGNFLGPVHESIRVGVSRSVKCKRVVEGRSLSRAGVRGTGALGDAHLVLSPIGPGEAGQLLGAELDFERGGNYAIHIVPVVMP